MDCVILSICSTRSIREWHIWNIWSGLGDCMLWRGPFVIARSNLGPASSISVLIDVLKIKSSPVKRSRAKELDGTTFCSNASASIPVYSRGKARNTTNIVMTGPTSIVMSCKLLSQSTLETALHACIEISRLWNKELGSWLGSLSQQYLLWNEAGPNVKWEESPTTILQSVDLVIGTYFGINVST